jgi:serine/threonine-protein kinase
LPSLAGTQLDKYDVLEEVGHGGMAVVYRAIDRVLKREVAIKVLHAHLADRAESRARLEREAIAVAKLRHENILEIFDYSGTSERESYIVTEFIHGPTLRDWLEDDYQARPAIAALVVHRLALALVHAHQSGIVHRDIKPENVMIRRDDGCIKLMDFGIAQILDNQKLTMTGQLIGSPAYMAPELINGRPLDARTDLFSLGILLFQLATGELPFAGRNPHEVLNRIADGNYPAPSTVNPLVDGDLEAILARALATNPDERFQSAEAMARELEAYLAEMELEPTAAELRTYFRGAKEAIAELDARVSVALMTRARRAAEEGLNGRALRLVGRVLELDRDNKEARAMLQRLRIHARRMRQIMIGGAALGLVGLVAAGAILLPSSSWVRPEQAAADGGVEPITSLGAVPVLGDDGDAPATITGADDATPASVSVSEPPVVASGAVPVPDPGEAPTPVTDGASSGGAAAGDGGGGRPSTSKPASPRPPAPPRTPPRTECTLSLSGIALSTARNQELKIRPTDGSGAVTQPIESLSFAVSFSGSEANVSIDDGAWKAARRITRTDCLDGKVVTIHVVPKPARLRFQGAPNGLAVTCETGCPDGLLGQSRTALADRFPLVPFEPGTDSRRVTLQFKTEDYKPKTIEWTLRPGDNSIPTNLVPRTSG